MGENNVKEIKCESVKDFIKKISYKGKWYGLVGKRYIYRGESSDKYKLIPSALREQNHESLVNLVNKYFPNCRYKNDYSEYFQMIAEYISLHTFYKCCDYRGLHLSNTNDFRNKLVGKVNTNIILYNKSTWLPSEYIELAGLAQHYGVYTRLLDWSKDINVAIYFAISGLVNFKESEKPKNIVLWVLDTLAFRAPEENTPGIVLYTPEYASNPNLCAQKGVLSLNCINNNIQEDNISQFKNETKNKEVKPFDEIIKEQVNGYNEEPILYKILIPTPQDDELYNYLRHQGYDASLIFPGYGGAAKTIKEDLYWKNLKNVQDSK